MGLLCVCVCWGVVEGVPSVTKGSPLSRGAALWAGTRNGGCVKVLDILDIPEIIALVQNGSLLRD